jgi:tetratricopeptide (TPR) repeat protein
MRSVIIGVIAIFFFSCSNPQKEASELASKAFAYLGTEEREKALEYADKAIDKYQTAKYIDEKYCSLFFLRAMVYSKKDNADEACRNYKYGLELVDKDSKYRSKNMVEMINLVKSSLGEQCSDIQ